MQLALQDDLLATNSRCANRLVVLNPLKCKHVLFSCPDNLCLLFSQHNIQSTALEYVHSYKCLELVMEHTDWLYTCES